MTFRLTRGGQIIISLICALVLLSSPLTALADDIATVERSIQERQNQLSEIEQELAELSDEITITEQQIETTTSAIYRTTEELAEAKAGREQQYEDMRTRIRFVYEAGSTSLIELLFTAESMVDFLNKADFIQAVSNYDRDMLLELQAAHDAVESSQKDLENQQAALIEIQDNLEAQQEQLNARAAETSTDLDAFREQLAELRAEEARQQQAAADAVRASQTPRGDGSDASPPANRPPVNATANDLLIFAAILEAEAFQNYNYLLAVATVIMNRVADPRFPNTVNGVIFQPGQFSPTWTGRFNTILNRGPTALSRQVAADALNGARHPAALNYFFFLSAASTNRQGTNIGGNLFFRSW